MNKQEKLRKFLNKHKKLVIIGCGNPLRGDDGVGPHIVQNLKLKIQSINPSEQASKGAKQGKIIQDSRLNPSDYLGTRILDSKIVLINAETVLENFTGQVVKEKPSHVLIIDAAMVEGREPGEWLLLEPWQMDSGFHSTHSMPISLFCQMVEKETGCSIMGLGVAPEQTELAGELSTNVRRAADRIVDLILALHRASQEKGE